MNNKKNNNLNTLGVFNYKQINLIKKIFSYYDVKIISNSEFYSTNDLYFLFKKGDFNQEELNILKELKLYGYKCESIYSSHNIKEDICETWYESLYKGMAQAKYMDIYFECIEDIEEEGFDIDGFDEDTYIGVISGYLEYIYKEIINIEEDPSYLDKYKIVLKCDKVKVFEDVYSLESDKTFGRIPSLVGRIAKNRGS